MNKFIIITAIISFYFKQSFILGILYYMQIELHYTFNKVHHVRSVFTFFLECAVFLWVSSDTDGLVHFRGSR